MVLKRYPKFSYGFGKKRKASFFINVLDYFLEWFIFCLVVLFIIIVKIYHKIRGEIDEEME